MRENSVQTYKNSNNFEKFPLDKVYSTPVIVLQISRLPEGSTGKNLLTTRAIYQTKLEILQFIKLADDISDSVY